MAATWTGAVSNKGSDVGKLCAAVVPGAAEIIIPADLAGARTPDFPVRETVNVAGNFGNDEVAGPEQITSSLWDRRRLPAAPRHFLTLFERQGT